jgi:pyruvate dehydrogenase E2 component (dihydrolipoamide acetyltransferase)
MGAPMTVDIVMPPLSQTSDTLILAAWLKKEGDPVAKGAALFEVETDKATLTVESPAAGTLQEISVEPGAEVAVRAKIGSIGAEQAEPAPAGQTIPEAPAAGPNHQPARAANHRPRPAEKPGRILASPRARRLADEQGLTLTGMTATGPRGMIVERDVRAYLASAAGAAAEPAPTTPEASASQRLPLTATRKTIARRMQASHAAATPVTLTRDTDATELVALRERLLAELAGEGLRPSYTDFLVSIAARCLGRHPHLNAHFDGEALELFEAVHMGLAVDTDRGLLVPVLRDAAHKGLAALAHERSDLVQRTLDGTVTPAELSGGTFTLTNLGSLGVDAFTPLLNPPQVAILGVGRIRPVAAPFKGAIAIRQAMFLSLTFDHRAVDGAPAARLLADIAALVEQPDRVWL